MNDFHPLVARFGDVVNDYDARPTYPSRTIELLRLYCGLSAESTVVDLGAGTGHAFHWFTSQRFGTN